MPRYNRQADQSAEGTVRQTDPVETFLRGLYTIRGTVRWTLP